MIEKVIRLYQARQKLEGAAVLAFTEDGNTHPAPGVEVKQQTQLVYSAADALAWAKKHEMAIQLDTKVFEAVAKAEANRPAFVSVQTTPKAFISSDLSKALAEGGSQGAGEDTKEVVGA